MGTWKSFFRQKIKTTFTAENKFKSETRTKFNLRNIGFVFITLLIFLLVGLFAFLPDEKKREVAAGPALDFRTGVPTQGNQGVNPKGTSNKNSQFADTSHGIGYGGTGSLGGSFSQGRNRNANQVIKRGANGNDSGAALPMGTTIPATLLSNVVTTNTSSPVIAIIPNEIQSNSGTSIPEGTKAIGGASFDEGGRRIQIHFSTLVYPDGTQHQIQALAMMNDGSGGVSGDYHSGDGTRQAGKFISYFVSGVAAGMKDQTSVGAFGSQTMPGSVKNGLLSGVALSSEDQAKSYSDGLTAEKASMTLNRGSSFLLFLEKEFLP